MVVENGEPLTERELEITELVAEGLTNREVAERLYLSHNTVKVHLRNIFTKTGVASRTELSMLAVQEGWITVPGVTEETEAPASPDGQRADSAGAAEGTSERMSRWLPAWPWQRWASLGFGVILALLVLVLPQRRSRPASATGPGDVFGTTGGAPQITGPAADDGWEELAPLPVRRAGMGVVALDNRIYAVGGMTDNGASGRLDIYDISTDTWLQATPRALDLANVGAAVVNGEILVPGGCENDSTWTPSAAVHRYRPETDTWHPAAPLPTPLCAYAIAAYDDHVYLFGGWDGDAYRALAYVYTPTEDTWREISPPEQPRGFGGAATLVDRIFYVGGYDGDREWATCEVYFPESDEWDMCQPMLQPRGGLSLSAIGGRLYAIGGGWQTVMGFNERYTPASDTWSVLETPIVSEWRNLGTVPWETSIYAIGGWSGTDFLNRTYGVEIMPWRVFIPGTFRTP
ncbi:MAG: Kelch repeat-containing protein [Anaerolineae bacterium]